MIKFFFLLLLFCVVFASSAFATTQYYYLRTTGAGSNSGDTGTWVVVPTTDAHAMSASNFHDSGNWSVTDDANKLDDDDVVYVKATTWNGYNLTIDNPITLDFYEAGDYDPLTQSHTLEPVFHDNITINSSSVIIQDGRFANDFRNIKAILRLYKYTGLKVLRNYFDMAKPNGQVSIHWGFVNDSEIAYNYFDGYDQNECASDLEVHLYQMRSIAFSVGSRNTIHHNYIDGGWTGPYFTAGRTWDDNLYDMDIPGSGSYTIDPDANVEDNVISYNTLVRRCQEGFTFDVSSNNRVCSAMEYDTVATVNGTTVTLDNSGGEWTGVGNLYSGYYMTATTDRDDTFGNHSLIEAQTDNSFTLATAITNLAPGDVVTISIVFRHNWIHHNIIGSGGGYGQSSILLEGTSLENLVEDNTFAYRNSPTQGYGITIHSLLGYTKAYGSVTGTYASEPSAYNIVRNNDVGGIWVDSFDKNYGTSYDFDTRNNAIYDNTVFTAPRDYYPRYVKLRLANTYVNNSGDIDLGVNGSLRATDPTGYVANYFSNWELPLASPELPLASPELPLASPNPPQNIKIISK